MRKLSNVLLGGLCLACMLPSTIFDAGLCLWSLCEHLCGYVCANIHLPGDISSPCHVEAKGLGWCAQVCVCVVSKFGVPVSLHDWWLSQGASVWMPCVLFFLALFLHLTLHLSLHCHHEFTNG